MGSPNLGLKLRAMFLLSMQPGSQFLILILKLFQFSSTVFNLNCKVIHGYILDSQKLYLILQIKVFGFKLFLQPEFAFIIFRRYFLRRNNSLNINKLKKMRSFLLLFLQNKNSAHVRTSILCSNSEIISSQRRSTSSAFSESS